jgi:hypothetical protein
MNAASEYHWLINVARSVALVVAIVSLSGCITADTIDNARSDRRTIKSGDVEIDYQVKPRYYALVPLAIAADIVLVPVYAGAIIAVNTGMMRPR